MSRSAGQGERLEQSCSRCGFSGSSTDLQTCLRGWFIVDKLRLSLCAPGRPPAVTRRSELSPDGHRG